MYPAGKLRCPTTALVQAAIMNLAQNVCLDDF